MAYSDYTRDPSGVYTFGTGPDAVRGSGPSAEAKARQIEMMRQIDPELAAAAYPPDARTASAEDYIRGALAPRPDVGGVTLPEQQIAGKAPKPKHSLVLPEQEPITASGRRTEAEIRSAEEDSRRNAIRLSQFGTGAGNVVAKALGAEPLPTPTAAAPGGGKPEAAKGEANVGPQVDPSTLHFVGPQGGLAPPMSGGSPIRTKEMLASRATQQVITPDADKQALATAGESRLSAAQAGIDAGTFRAQEVAKAWREENTNLMREQQASQTRMAEARAQYSQMVGDVRRMNEQVQNEGIHDYWADKSTGTKFLSAIGVGLGVLGAGMKREGGGGVPLGMLKEAMNEDLEKQKANLANKRAGVAQAESLLGRYHEVLGDMNAAEAAARSSMLEAAARRVEQVMKDTESPMIQANGKVMLAGIMKDNAEEQAKLNQFTEHKAYKTVMTGGAPARPFAKNDGSFIDLPGGMSLKASSPEMATQWRQQLDAIPEIKDSAGQLRAELAKGPSFANSAKVKLLINNIATSLGAAKLGSSRMTGQGELENIQQIMDQHGALSSDVLGRTRAAIDVVEHTATSAQNRIYNSAPRYSRGVETPTGDIIRYRVEDAAPQGELHGRPVE